MRSPTGRSGRELVLAHGAMDLGRVVVRADGHRLALGQLTGRHGGRVATLGQHLHHNVAVGQHALEPVVVAADRQRTDPLLGHPLRGRLQVVWRH